MGFEDLGSSFLGTRAVTDEWNSPRAAGVERAFKGSSAGMFGGNAEFAAFRSVSGRAARSGTIGM